MGQTSLNFAPFTIKKETLTLSPSLSLSISHPTLSPSLSICLSPPSRFLSLLSENERLRFLSCCLRPTSRPQGGDDLLKEKQHQDVQQRASALPLWCCSCPILPGCPSSKHHCCLSAAQMTLHGPQKGTAWETASDCVWSMWNPGSTTSWLWGWPWVSK